MYNTSNKAIANLYGFASPEGVATTSGGSHGVNSVNGLYGIKELPVPQNPVNTPSLNDFLRVNGYQHVDQSRRAALIKEYRETVLPVIAQQYGEDIELVKQDFDRSLPQEYRDDTKEITRGWFRSGGDKLIEIGSAATGLVKAVSDFVDPDSMVSKGLGKVLEIGREYSSDYRQDQLLRRELDLADEKAKGNTGMKSYLDYYGRNPMSAVTEVIGSLGPLWGVGKGAKLIGGVRAAQGAMMGTGAAIGAGEVRGNIYEHIMGMKEEDLLRESSDYRTYLQYGMDPKEARRQVATAFAKHGAEIAGGAALGGATSLFGVEKVFAGLPSKGIIKTTLGEAAQEAVQEGGGRLLSNIAIGKEDSSKSLYEDVAANAATGALLGGIGGSGVSLVSSIRGGAKADNDAKEIVDQVTSDNNSDSLLAIPKNNASSSLYEEFSDDKAKNISYFAQKFGANEEEQSEISAQLTKAVANGTLNDLALSDALGNHAAQVYLENEEAYREKQAKSEQSPQPDTEKVESAQASTSDGLKQTEPRQSIEQTQDALQNEPSSDDEGFALEQKNSRSAIKSVQANIKRGRDAMNTAIAEKTTVHRAMFNHELNGWVDFEWGDVGRLSPSGKTKGAMGISHIIESRMRKDSMSYAQATRMLTDRVVETIAKGTISQIYESGKVKSVFIEYNGNRATLIKREGSNSWLMNAFELKPTDEQVGSNDPSLSTQTLPTRQRQGMGAAGKDNVQNSQQQIKPKQENSRTKEQEKHIHHLTQTIEKAIGKKNAQHIEILTQEEAERPDGVKSLNLTDVEGYYNPTTGKVTLIADNLTERTAVFVAWHELGHLGIDTDTFKSYRAVLNNSSKNKYVALLADKIMQDRLGTDDVAASDRLLVVEEAIVELLAAKNTGDWAHLESKYGMKFPDAFKRNEGSVLAVVMRRLKEILGKLFGVNAKDFSDNQVLELLGLINNSIGQARQTTHSGNGNLRFSGQSSFSVKTIEADSVEKQAEILQGEPVARIDSKRTDTPDSGGFAIVSAWAKNLFRKMGGYAINPILGRVNLSDKSVRDSLAHGRLSYHKNLAFNTVKDVLERGTLIATDYATKEHDSFYISAPVLIDEKENIVTVLVHRDNSNQRMYLHGVTLKEKLLMPRVSTAYDNQSRKHSSSLTSADVHNLLHNALTFNLAQYIAGKNARKDTVSVADTPKFSRVKPLGTSFDEKAKELGGEKAYQKALSSGMTELSYENWVLVRTPAFKRFFGNWEKGLANSSKVINPKTGEPLVVFHVTDGDFSEFNLSESRVNADVQGFYFSSGTEDWSDMGENIMPVFLNIRNPSDAKPIVRASENNAGIKARQQLISAGYDGAIEKEEGMETEYLVLNPNQIKSATDNNGEFDGNNPDIRFSRVANRSKKESLEKLRQSESIKISGKEIEASEDLKQYKRNALEYGKSLRGTYVNKDSGRRIELGASGVKEVLQHDYKNPEHLQSVAAIPQIIENAIYIDTLQNEDLEKNPSIQEYEYYVAGLNIGGRDYTVKAVVAISENGERYYDHKLSEINKDELLSYSHRITNPGTGKTNSSLKESDLLEARHADNKSGVPQQQSTLEKGELLSLIDRLSNAESSENKSPLSNFDDKRLLQILQDNSASDGNIRFSRQKMTASNAEVSPLEDITDKFNQELAEFVNGQLTGSHIFNLGKPSELLKSVGFPDLPIELKASKLSEKANTDWHKFDIADVKGLPNALQNPLAVFSYGDKTKSHNVITQLEIGGKQLLVGVHFNQNRNGLSVNSIRGLFPKDNAEWLNWIGQKDKNGDDKHLYLDKQKIQTLINQQRTNLADVGYLDLDLIESLIQKLDGVNDDENQQKTTAKFSRKREIEEDAKVKIQDLVSRVRQDKTLKRTDEFARKAEVLQGEPVYTITERKAPKENSALRQWAIDLFNRAGGKAVNPEIGEVTLNERSVKNSMAHGMNPLKASAFESISKVIEQGVVIAQAEHGETTSYFISAPVRIENVDTLVNVLVHKDVNKQSMYLHSVQTKENLLDLTKNESVADIEISKPHGKLSPRDIASILQKHLVFNLDENSGKKFSRKREIEEDAKVKIQDLVSRVRQDKTLKRTDEFARKAEVLQGEPVYTITERKAPKENSALRQWAIDLFNRAGGKAVNPEIGEVILNARSVKDDLAHGISPDKATAFEAVVDVIEKGVVVATANHERLTSSFISAPVEIEGKVNIVTALVRKDVNSQRFYLHSVIPKEKLLKEALTGLYGDSVADVKTSEPHGKLRSGDIASILQKYLVFNLDENSGKKFSRKRDSVTPQVERTKTVKEIAKSFTQKDSLEAVKSFFIEGGKAPQPQWLETLTTLWFDAKAPVSNVLRRFATTTKGKAFEHSMRTYQAVGQKTTDLFLETFYEPMMADLKSQWKREFKRHYKDLGGDGWKQFLEDISTVGNLVKHGRERNAVILRKTEGKDTAGSGRTNEEIDEIEKALQQQVPGLIEFYESLYKNHLKPMLDYRDKTLKDSGLLTDEMIEARDDYQWYVPLYGDPNEDGTAGNGFFNAPSPQIKDIKDKKAKGRAGTLADNVIQNVMIASESAIKRASQQPFLYSLFDFLESMPAARAAIQAKINTPDTKEIIEKYVDRDGIVKERIKPSAAMDKDAIVFRNGHEIKILKIGHKRVLEALQGLNKANIEGLFALQAKATRALSAIYTRYNPMFPLMNKVRDSQAQMSFILADAPVKNPFAAAMKAVAYNVAFTSQWRKNPNSTYHVWREKYERLGGATMYIDLFRDDVMQNISEDFAKGVGASTLHQYKAMKDAVVNIVDGINEHMEMTSRVAAFKALVESGMTEKEAALYVKNLMNFETRGKYGQQMGAVYSFANAALYDARRMMQSLRTTRGSIVMTAHIGLMFMLYGALKALAGDDEDGIARLNKVPLSSSGRFLTFIDPHDPEGKGYKIPVGFGFGRISLTIAAAMHRFYDGVDTRAEFVENVVKEGLASNLSPLEPIDISISKHPFEYLIQQFSPTVVRPLVQLSQNKTGQGYSIRMPDEWIGEGLKFEKAFPATNRIWRDMAKQVYDSTGVDLSPEVFRFLTQSYLGSGGMEIFRGLMLADEKAGTELTMSDIPLAQAFSFKGIRYEMNQFIEKEKQIKRLLAERKYAMEQGNLTEFDSEHPGLLFLENYFKQVNKELKKLKNERKTYELITDPMERQRKTKEINERIRQVQMWANKAVRDYEESLNEE